AGATRRHDQKSAFTDLQTPALPDGPLRRECVMTPITCPEVLDQIELYASDECEEPARTAIENHLATCSDCAAAHREATRLAGLPTLHFQEEAGLGRLQERLRSEARRSRGAARVLPIVHRWMAAAAMLLVAIGPFLWLALTARHGPDEGLPGLSIAWENRT